MKIMLLLVMYLWWLTLGGREGGREDGDRDQQCLGVFPVPGTPYFERTLDGFVGHMHLQALRDFMV